MKKIKIASVLIFILSVSLAILSNSINHDNKINANLLNTINKQKAITQEISKNIFYIYKNKDASTSQLDNSIKQFTHNTNSKNKMLDETASANIKKQTLKILVLWNNFYTLVEKFKNASKITTPYSNIILEQIVKDIYNTNLKLVVEFDKLIKMHQSYYKEIQRNNKNFQYTLFILFLLLLIYLFTQIKIIISFMQKFLQTSKNIVKNHSIKDLKPIEPNKNSSDVLEATNNFNFIIEKINNSIEYSSNSVKHSYRSIELIEKNIEKLLELLSIMQEDKEFDKELTKKEDAIIQSLEELISSIQKLKNLKLDLDNLISYHTDNNS